MATLNEIEKRLEAATPGIRTYERDTVTGTLFVSADDGNVIDSDVANFEREADAEQFAHAPTDIAHLLRIARAAADYLASHPNQHHNAGGDALREALEASNDQDA